MTRRVLGLVLSASTLALGLVGCNQLLDNNPGTPVETEQAGTTPGPVTPGSQIPGADGGDLSSSTGCPAGQQACFGTCVSMLDPLYGCGDPSCAPCASTHATMACQGRQCVVSACEAGYANCNAKAADGCETDLSKAATCGSCNAACGAAAALCAPLGPSFQCSSACTPGAPLQCGAECVDPQTSINHCGGCNVRCPVVANATTSCNAGACAIACKVQMHACAGKCVSNTDPASCGAACTACPAPAGGAATCVNDTCGVKCHGKTVLCGGACVSDAAFDSDPLNCGVCGKSCAGGACMKGACTPPPPL